MKTRIILPVLFCILSCYDSQAQSDTAIATEKATYSAENLINAFRFKEWDKYLALSYPGAVKYYGGKNGYMEQVQRARNNYKDLIQENPEKIRIIQLENDIQEWQCVIEKSRETYIDGKKGKIISYMVGQSTDDGLNWLFFDVAHNSVENVIYIMPDIFSNLAIPQRSTVFYSDLGFNEAGYVKEK